MGQDKAIRAGYTMQHPQTLEIECVYHGRDCLVPCDGEVVCRVFGTVIRRIEDAGVRGGSQEAHTRQFGGGSSEDLGTVQPILNPRSQSIHRRHKADAIWQQRIRHIADQFGIKKSLRDEIEYVFLRLRRKTSYRPSLILFFAFYNTCREHGSCAISESMLQDAICHCCNLKGIYSILKVYGMFSTDAQRLGLYRHGGASGFYFNSFLRAASESLGLDDSARNTLERHVRAKYATLPSSMGEKTRTKNAFLATLGGRMFGAVSRRVRY